MVSASACARPAMPASPVSRACAAAGVMSGGSCACRSACAASRSVSCTSCAVSVRAPSRSRTYVERREPVVDPLLERLAARRLLSGHECAECAAGRREQLRELLVTVQQALQQLVGRALGGLCRRRRRAASVLGRARLRRARRRLFCARSAAVRTRLCRGVHRTKQRLGRLRLVRVRVRPRLRGSYVGVRALQLGLGYELAQEEVGERHAGPVGHVRAEHVDVLRKLPVSGVRPCVDVPDRRGQTRSRSQCTRVGSTRGSGARRARAPRAPPWCARLAWVARCPASASWAAEARPGAARPRVDRLRREQRLRLRRLRRLAARPAARQSGPRCPGPGRCASTSSRQAPCPGLPAAAQARPAGPRG